MHVLASTPQELLQQILPGLHPVCFSKPPNSETAYPSRQMDTIIARKKPTIDRQP